MRTLTAHHTNEVNKSIRLYADDRDAENGNGSHAYCMQYDRQEDYDLFPTAQTQSLFFQKGPIAETGVNGTTNEVLLAIVADRLEGFQTGAWANDFNKTALEHIYAALKALEARTLERTARGVEGTSQL